MVQHKPSSSNLIFLHLFASSFIIELEFKPGKWIESINTKMKSLEKWNMASNAFISIKKKKEKHDNAYQICFIQYTNLWWRYRFFYYQQIYTTLLSLHSEESEFGALNFSDMLLTQCRSSVGVRNPSPLKTWPRCPPQAAHVISTLRPSGSGYTQRKPLFVRCWRTKIFQITRCT